MFYNILNLLRIHQWIKNIFIFLPLFFDKKLNDFDRLTDCFFAFIGFSLFASAIYCLNDIVDKDEDKKHPSKKNRPIASGKIPISLAYILIVIFVLAASGMLLFLQIPVSVLLIILFYFILNVAYCFRLKKIAIIDVFVIATGFVIRIIVGGLAGNVSLSHWIIIMTFLLALFLGFAKRLDDLQIYNNTGVSTRKNIIRYNTILLSSLLIITATITVVAYLMYTVSIEVISRFESDYVYITSLFVILGIFRYLQLTMVDKRSSSPTKILLHDRFLQVCILMWVLSFVLIIYVL